MSIKLKHATGYRTKGGALRVAVSFPETLFKAIARRANAERRSFSSMVVELCQIGEFDLSESDALEPKASTAKQPTAKEAVP